jgi:hypothetical protein
MKRAVIAVILLVLTGCGDSVDKNGVEKSGGWQILWSYDMPPKPTMDGSSWYFDFPTGTNCPRKCPGVHYVMKPYNERLEYGGELVITGRIEVTGNPTFNYKFEKANTCDFPAHARAMVQRKNDDMRAEDNRYFGSRIAIPLGPGNFSATIPLKEGQWANVDGKFNLSGFKKTLEDIGNVGLTFGGGCFYGHGVNVSGGTARFVVTGYDFK